MMPTAGAVYGVPASCWWNGSWGKELTTDELVRHAFGGGCGGVQIAFLRGGCVRVVLLGLD